MVEKSPKINKRIDHNKQTHTFFIGLISIFLFAPIFLEHKAQGNSLTLYGYKLPALCPTQGWFKVECPGCGLSRSFTALTHGKLRQSLKHHRIGILLYLFFIYLLAFHIYGISNLHKDFSLCLQKVQYYAPLGMIALLIANWGIGLYTGTNGS